MENDLLELKIKVYQHLQSLIDQRIANASSAMKEVTDSKLGQTKSSAGDKFETGRAMMQAVEERNKVQLIKAIALQNELKQINPELKQDIGRLCSLVMTNSGNYFLSVGLGKIVVDKTTVYAISVVSPIGKLIIGKNVGDTITFREKDIFILHIV